VTYNTFSSIADLDALEELLSRPDDDLVADMLRLMEIFWCSGQQGRWALPWRGWLKRAAPNKVVYAAARFSDRALIDEFEAQEIVPIRADLLEPEQIRDFRT
jgi:hypothetical protein